MADGITGSGPPLAAEVTVAAGTATIVLRGDLDPVTMPLLARRLARVLAGRPQRLVLDLAGVTFIDCASARLIAGTGKHLPDGARPTVRSPSPAARRVLELTGLADHLETPAPGAGSPAAGGPVSGRALPGAPFQAWFGQPGRLQERGRRTEVERADR